MSCAADVAERYRVLSVTPVGAAPAETAALLAREAERWRNIIAAGGLKPP
jgi:tripartite-type tricarboxylate transporter receptor subunit TctC